MQCVVCKCKLTTSKNDIQSEKCQWCRANETKEKNK